jgi:hypothetical protein
MMMLSVVEAKAVSGGAEGSSPPMPANVGPLPLPASPPPPPYYGTPVPVQAN